MQKIGSLTVNGITYNIILYSDNGSERIDITLNPDAYTYLNTIECEASYIYNGNTGSTYVKGERSLISAYQTIKSDAMSLRCEEKSDVELIDGQIVYVLSKKDPSGRIEYTRKVVDAKLNYEEFITEDGMVSFATILDKKYNTKDLPINFNDYERMDLLSTTGYRAASTRTTSYYSYDELLQKYPQVTHVLDNDYVIVENYDQAVERLNIWINSKQQLKGFDIESTSTDWGPTSQCRITGVFLGLGVDWSTYFPFRQDTFEYNLPIEFLRTVFDAINNQPPAPEVIILGHNVKFEIQGFYQEYRDFIRCDVDTYLLAVLANPEIRKGTHTLKALTSQVDHKFYLTLEDIFIGPVQFNVLPPEIVKLYGCPDATSPAKIYPWLMSKIPKDEKFVIELEMKLPVVKAMNEFYGIRLDQEKLDETLDIAEKDSELLANWFKTFHKTMRNINSPETLRTIIYDHYRCPVEMRTKKGLPATSKAAIERIIKKGKCDQKDTIPQDLISADGKTVLVEGKALATNRYPSLIVYQRYKLLQKTIGALRRLKSKSVADFFKFYINQSGAGSNRQTSDAHQFDDTMKKCALADSPQHQLVSCDWKQVELRILAGMAKQEDLIELEKDPNVDIHRAILSIIQGKPMYLISEEDRKKGKSVNFGVVYGMTEYGLAQRDFGIGYTKENLNEERKKITDFFNGLPKIKTFIHDNKEFMKTHGYIKTAFNYYRYFPKLLDPDIDRKTTEKIMKQGGNTPIQGTGAQMLKIVEERVWDYIRSKGWDKERDYNGLMLPMVRMIVPIHDEILLSYDKSIPMEEIITMFKQCMELEIDGMPPFFAAPAFIDNWYQGKDDAYEVDLEFRDRVVEEYKKGNMLLTGHDYLATLQNFRDESLSIYMSNLINKYKTPEEVAAHVKDDSLTHTLISTLPKDVRKKLSHTDRIYEATKMFMGREDLDQILIVNEEAAEDYEDRATMDEWLEEESFQVDANGDVIIEEREEDEDEYYSKDTYEVVEPAKTFRVMYTLNECLVDFTGYGDEEFQKLLKLCDKDAYYTLILVREQYDDNGNKVPKVVATNYKIGYMQDEIEDIFKEETVNAEQ